MNPILVIATNNLKKGREMATFLDDLLFELKYLTDFPPQPEVEEIGASYLENATLKAVAAAKATGCLAIADDAGLEIDALNGAPGLYSRRFAGEDTPWPEKMSQLLNLLRDVPEAKRTCRFHCAISIAGPDGHVQHAEGICEGRIAYEMKGSYGFGYDPIFLLPKRGLHMAELPPAEKNLISHRAQAMKVAREILKSLRAEL